METKITPGRMLGVALASGALALGLLAGGSTAASATGGTCYYVNAQSDGRILYSCKGTVTIGWTCWSDLLGRWNYKTLKLGSLGLSSSFRACTTGNMHYITWS